MTITALPTPPLRSDPSNFADRADTFLAALPLFATEANALAAAMNLNSTTDSSTTSVLIGTGAKAFTVSPGKSFQPGMYIVIADAAAPGTNSMWGQVTSYSGTSLNVNVIAVLGSGTKASWVISQSAPGGANRGANSDITSLSAISSINSGQLAGLRNRVINGSFSVWQRGVAFTASSTGAYMADRWICAASGANLSVTRGAGYSNIYGLALTGATGSTYAFLKHRIESVNSYSLANQKITVSGKIYNNNVTLPGQISLAYATVADNFTATTAIESKTISITGSTWTNFSFTTSSVLPAGTTAGLEVSINFTSGIPSGTGVVVSDIQVEIGEVATAFEQRPYGLEFMLCQRYYVQQAYTNYRYFQSAALLAFPMMSLHTQLRATPTVAFIGTVTYSGMAASGASLAGSNTDFIYCAVTASGAGEGGISAVVSLSAEL